MKTVHPGFDLASEAASLVDRDHPVELDRAQDLLRQGLVRLLPALRTLPEHVEALAGHLRSGRLVVRTKRFAGAEREIAEGWFNRVLAAHELGADD